MALSPWVDDANQALLTDLYQLTMLQAYWHEGMVGTAVFTFFCRRLPTHRNYLIACGIDDVLRCIETLEFNDSAIAYLSTLPQFDERFLEWLRGFRFSGEVRAVPEGTPVFANEPILEVIAPIHEAQLVETLLMNQLHLQTLLASKASRVVAAAKGRTVVDFGLRRIHGADAGLKSARAFYVAGVDATSNVLAGQAYGIPVSGTMAHSYVQAHDSEIEAFRRFQASLPETVLLVDTYDTPRGVDRVIELAQELGDRFDVRGVRLDSGNLLELARDARSRLDAAGLEHVQVFASGGLDEYAVRDLVDAGAPIDGFGVGTAMGVSADAPSLDVVYKLAEYAGRGRLKTSTGKPVLPGTKQVFRFESSGVAERDVIGRWEEHLDGRPLLRQVMRDGVRIVPVETLDTIRARVRDELDRLPPTVTQLEAADPPFPVEISEALGAYSREVVEDVAG